MPTRKRYAYTTEISNGSTAMTNSAKPKTRLCPRCGLDAPLSRIDHTPSNCIVRLKLKLDELTEQNEMLRKELKWQIESEHIPF